MGFPVARKSMQTLETSPIRTSHCSNKSYKELSVEDLLASTKTKQELEAIEFDGKSETRIHIEKFVQEKPEAVALLLRNWLNEDWE